MERSKGLPNIVERYYAAHQYAALIADLSLIHARPLGKILVADLGGTLVGCTMYYPLTRPKVTEVKRLYVEHGARGSRAGQALLTDAVMRARADGYTRIVLDTIAPLIEAIALHEKMGFAPCLPYYEPDPEFMPFLRLFDLPL